MSLKPLSHLLVFGLAYRAYKSNSLTPLGILASIATGLIHTSHRLYLPFVLLVGFYLPSNRFTKLKADIKSKLTVTAKGSNENREGGEGPRTHIQVFANSITASIFILLDTFTQGRYSSVLLMGVISQYVAVTADTWSSELGILSKSQPILITTLKPCPKGTNGGVSPLGLLVALAAGFYIGAISLVFAPFLHQLPAISKLKFLMFTTVLGLFGSVLDSVLGALFQKSVVNKNGLIVEAEGGGMIEDAGSTGKVVSGKLDLLTNNEVNLLMAAVSSVVGAVLWNL